MPLVLQPGWKALMGRTGATVLVAAAGVLAYWWFRSPPATRIKVGDPAPALELPTLGSGSPTPLTKFRGRVVLLAMFSSDCPLCDKELPILERLHREFTKKDLVVLGIGVDPEERDVAALVHHEALTFFVLHDPRGAAIHAAFGTTRLPEAYLIDRNGNVAAVLQGDLASRSTELHEQLQRLLKT
jgi:peroxiredoxin